MISIIIPTLNEAENLPLLVPQVAEAMRGREYEVLIVDDDSRDNTPQVCAELAREFRLRLLVRTSPKNGLSGAVLHGMEQARGEIFVVMDADLQHPPQQIPALIEPLEKGEAEFVIGARYMPGGGIEERWSTFRRINSRVATMLARPFTGPISDPMSGFFALRRETWQRGRGNLTPLGYKIALELMSKCQVDRVREIPIEFRTRRRGQSKLTLTQQFHYLEHLSRLYDFHYPRASPIVKFLIATACGWAAGAVLFILLLRGGAAENVAPPAAYLGAVAVTALFHLRYVRTQREFIARRRPWAGFAIISAAELAACAAVANWLTDRVPELPMIELFALSFGGATVVRYILRKELLQDIRGLRRDIRQQELDGGPTK